ncbi:MAG: glutamate ligase domain-containing protein, partial [bacterium]
KGNYFLIPSKIKHIYQNYRNFDYFPNKLFYVKNYKVFINNEFFTSANLVFKGKSFKLEISNIIPKSTVFNFLVSLMMFDKIINSEEVVTNVVNNFENIIRDSLENDRFFFEKVNDDIFVISDFYNSNYLSLKENLKVVEMIASSFKNVVLFIGDMLELGKYSDFYHSLVVKKLVNSKMQVYFIGENFLKFRSYGNKLIKFFKNVDDIHEDLIKSIDKGTLIFIKGSRGIRLEKVYQKIKIIEGKKSFL